MLKDDIEEMKQYNLVEQEQSEGKKSNIEETYMSLGMCLGMCLGMPVGLLLFNNLARGLNIGMCLGGAIGVCIKKK